MAAHRDETLKRPDILPTHLRTLRRVVADANHANGPDDFHYRKLGGRLQPILETIRRLHEMGFWVEIVTLLIPGFNDSEEELTRLTEFLVSLSPDIPWHVTAFHRDYKMTDPEILVRRT